MREKKATILNAQALNSPHHFNHILLTCSSSINTLYMHQEKPDSKTRNYILRKSIMDYGMGIIILGFGVFFALSDKLGFSFNVDSFIRYLFAGLCMVYGGFRIYRGQQKKYFNNG
jgi:hypothetical protein